MSGFLRQSTAAQSRLIGPFIDDTDFKTAAAGLTIANTDVKLRANGTTLSNKNSGGGTHQVNGMYSLTWDATDTANVGELHYSVVVAGALQVFGMYTVLEEAVYDALFAASAPGYVANAPVNAAQWGGSNVATPTVAGVPEVDVTHWIGTAAATPTVAGVPEVDVTHIAGTTDPATRLGHGAKAIAFGTVDSGASTTSVPTSALSPASGVADQFKNGVIVFKGDTTTANLRGARARITANTSGGTLTVSPALPATPASGDTFAIV